MKQDKAGERFWVACQQTPREFPRSGITFVRQCTRYPPDQPIPHSNAVTWFVASNRWASEKETERVDFLIGPRKSLADLFVSCDWTGICLLSKEYLFGATKRTIDEGRYDSPLYVSQPPISLISGSDAPPSA